MRILLRIPLLLILINFPGIFSTLKTIDLEKGLSCNFDAGNTCNWNPTRAWRDRILWTFGPQSNGNKNWTPRTGSPGKGKILCQKKNVGSLLAFAASKYIYVQPNVSDPDFPRDFTALAELKSAWIAATNAPFCLSFSYHIAGPQLGHLGLFLIGSDKNGIEITDGQPEYFSRSAATPDRWQQFRESIPAQSLPFKVR